MTTNQEWFTRAQDVIPGGVDSPVAIAVVPASSRRQIAPGRRDHDAAMQFSAHVGLGLTFGDRSQYDIAYRVQKIDADPGSQQIRLTYAY